MSDNLKQIFELSKHPWIQEQWNPRIGDYFYDGNNKIFHIVYSNNKRIDIFRTIRIGELNPDNWWDASNAFLISDKKIVWLPIGVNLETGNFQVDELIEKLAPKGELTIQRDLNPIELNKVKEALEKIEKDAKLIIGIKNVDECNFFPMAPHGLIGKLEFLNYILKEQDRQAQNKKEQINDSNTP